MSISYTKRGWTNNSPPAINAAGLIKQSAPKGLEEKKQD